MKTVKHLASKKAAEKDAQQKLDLRTAKLDNSVWGWLVCLTACCTNGSIFCVNNTFGIVGDWLIHKYDVSTAVVGLVGSLSFGCLFFFSFFGSIIMDRIGIRPCAFIGAFICVCSFIASSFFNGYVYLLFFTHSFLFGFGASLIYTPSLVILSHYFDKHLGLANGFVTLGSGIFTVVLSKLLKSVLLDIAGLENTFRIFACFSGLFFLYALSWKPTRETRHQELDYFLSTDTLRSAISGCHKFLAKFLNVQMWKKRSFLVWIVGVPVALFGYSVPFMFLPNFIQERKMKQLSLTLNISFTAEDTNSSVSLKTLAHKQADDDVASILITISVLSGVSRVLVGKLADFKCVNRVRLQQLAFLLLGVAICLFPHMESKVLMILLSMVFGFCDGTFVCLIGPIAFDLVGPTAAAQGIGFLLLMISAPLTVGPFISGYIRDVSGQWDIPFYIAGAGSILGSLILCLIPPVKQHFPAVTVAEDQKFMANSNLDLNISNLVDSDGVWEKAPSASITSLAKRMFTSNNKLEENGREEIEPLGGSLETDPEMGNGQRRSTSQEVTERESSI